eukprot:scaffold148609_cov112-Cyclotella_meneghiniana.AAC.2
MLFTTNAVDAACIVLFVPGQFGLKCNVRFQRFFYPGYHFNGIFLIAAAAAAAAAAIASFIIVTCSSVTSLLILAFGKFLLIGMMGCRRHGGIDLVAIGQ